jgi:hypothetical protein
MVDVFWMNKARDFYSVKNTPITRFTLNVFTMDAVIILIDVKLQPRAYLMHEPVKIVVLPLGIAFFTAIWAWFSHWYPRPAPLIVSWPAPYAELMRQSDPA